MKARLTSVTRLYPGMYGKLMVPAGERETIVVPPRSLQQVGQLKMVHVQDKGGWKRRYVRTGRDYDGQVEILSGLSGGEELGVVRRETS